MEANILVPTAVGRRSFNFQYSVCRDYSLFSFDSCMFVVDEMNKRNLLRVPNAVSDRIVGQQFEGRGGKIHI